MHHILKLTSSVLFLLLIGCTPVAAQDLGKDPPPFSEELEKSEGEMPQVGIFYNLCMPLQLFSDTIKAAKEKLIFTSPSQQHGPYALVMIFTNETKNTYTIALQNTQLPNVHPTKVCLLASGNGFEFMIPMGIRI